jgi:hypothetical protein
VARLATHPPDHAGLLLVVEPGLVEPFRTIALAITAVVVNELDQRGEGSKPL